MNSGSAVSVQLEDDLQTVTAMASPAGRDENSCMPIQATPASVRPIHTLLPSSRNSVTISSVVMATSFIVQGLLRRGVDAAATQLQHPVVDQRDEQHYRAQRHGDLGNPQRGGVVGSGDVVEGVRHPGQAHRVE